MADHIKEYIKAHSKSQLTGLIFTLLLGPLGLFYCRKMAALILTVIAIISAASIVGPIACWALSILLSFGGVSQHNKKVLTTANLAGLK